jgi:hypothetical protein
MSLFTVHAPQPQLPKRLPGSPHWGRAWTFAVHNLRAAVGNATHHAWKSHFTAHQVGDEVIDLVTQLDGESLAVLRVVIGELAKQSKKRGHQW